jgi:hypothetical protein
MKRYSQHMLIIFKSKCQQHLYCWSRSLIFLPFSQMYKIYIPYMVDYICMYMYLYSSPEKVKAILELKIVENKKTKSKK